MRQVIFCPAECHSYCEDDACPYAHLSFYELWEDGEYFAGPFDTEEEAKVYDLSHGK